jgi:hypothetical protein
MTTPTPAELLAKIQPLLVPANRINPNTPLKTSYGTGTIYVYKLPGTNPPVLVVQTSGAVDCDGQTTTKCNIHTDPAYQNDTSFHQSDGKPLNAATLPFYVLPVVGPYFDYTKNGIQGGQLGAIIYNNNMNYGVFGDEDANNRHIGEVSYAMAASIGIDPDPSTGGIESGVTFIIFTGSGYVVSPIESRLQAVTMGDTALAILWSQLGGVTPVLTTIAISPTSVSINIGTTQQLIATCRDQNNNVMACPTLTWTCSNTSIATVSSSGLVNGISMGIVNITASAGGKTSNISIITVTSQPVSKIFIVSTIGCPTTTGVMVMKSSTGDHTADEACQEVCNILRTIN